MRRLVAATAAGTLAVAASLLGALPASAAGTAEVYVVHGIPDLPVDVYVNGALTLDNFKPETVAGPLDLPAGSYDVAITKSDAKDDSAPLLTAKADLVGGTSVALVAHLSESGDPTITPYANDISTISAGQTRLVVRHDAAAPAVDIRAGGKVVLAGVTNPKEGVLNIPAGSVDADVVLAGTDKVAIGPATLDLAEGSATFVHAVGSAKDGTLALVSFTIPGLNGAPGGVPAGTGPADSSVPTILLVVLLTVGVAAVAIGGRRLYSEHTR
ncbi:MAG TPA: DUF4397 domain-containing protein [Nakamurella sp.]|jgi:hypothetical protein|nr:DUF4397 domain-containing protein [Nakamurella sp.]